MSDRWVFLLASLTTVLILAGAFVIPQFFGFEVLKSLMYVAIAILVFFGEDRFSYMLAMVAPILWFILNMVLGGFFEDLTIMAGYVVGKPSPPMDTPLHGLAILFEIGLVIAAFRVWGKQVTEKFFGKTFGICLGISLAYLVVLTTWYFHMVSAGVKAR